jgi:hypothetical protein
MSFRFYTSTWQISYPSSGIASLRYILDLRRTSKLDIRIYLIIDYYFLHILPANYRSQVSSNKTIQFPV